MQADVKTAKIKKKINKSNIFEKTKKIFILSI